MTSLSRCAVILRARTFLSCLLAMGLSAIFVANAQAQGGNNSFGNFGNCVGGVSIDAAGMVTPADKSARIPVRDALRKMHAAPPAELNGGAEMRMVSLRKLDAAHPFEAP